MCYLHTAPCWSYGNGSLCGNWGAWGALGRYGHSESQQAALCKVNAQFRNQTFKLKKKSCSQQVLWLCFPVHFHADEYMVTKILLRGLSFSCSRFLLLQRSFLICLQLGIFCLIVKDFLTAREENIRRDEPSEQELPMPLGGSSVSPKVFPAVEILVSTG